MERIALGKKKLVSNDRRRRRGKVHELELIFEPCEHTKIIQKVHKTSNSISLSPSLGLSVQKLRFLFRSSPGQAMALIHFVGGKKKKGQKQSPGKETVQAAEEKGESVPLK